MQDETSPKDLPAARPGGKPFLREQRLVAPRMVPKPSLDSVARWNLCLALAGVVTGVDRAALEAARKKESPLAPMLEQNPALKSAFEETEKIACTYLSRIAWGWNELPEQHELTKGKLERAKRYLERIAKYRNQVRVKAKAATKLMALVRPESQLENRLIVAGWPLEWPDEVMPRPKALLPGVDKALAELENDDPDNGEGLPKPKPGAPTQWAERQAFVELAAVWKSATGRRRDRGLDENDRFSSRFAEFAGAVLRAARPGLVEDGGLGDFDGTWFVQAMARLKGEAEQD